MSLSATGSVVLYNLELDLQPLLEHLPFQLERAFAHKLTVTVRWSSLTIQVWSCSAVIKSCLWCFTSPSEAESGDLNWHRPRWSWTMWRWSWWCMRQGSRLQQQRA